MSRRNIIMLDSFSGPAAALPKGYRTAVDVLRALAKAPRVSTWDMDSEPWLRGVIGDLKRCGYLAEDKDEPYPWHRYVLPESGKALAAPHPPQQ